MKRYRRRKTVPNLCGSDGEVWSPIVLCFDRGTCSNAVSADRNRLRELMSATHQRDAMALYHSGSDRRGQRNGTLFAAELEVGGDHGEVEAHAQLLRAE